MKFVRKLDDEDDVKAFICMLCDVMLVTDGHTPVSNRAPAGPQRGFELMFRFYAPKKESFDKAWVLPSMEPLAS
ncbi:MAG TPA: hypothetical protein VGM57_17235 [Pseudolabrys sp.]